MHADPLTTANQNVLQHLFHALLRLEFGVRRQPASLLLAHRPISCFPVLPSSAIAALQER